MSDEKDPVSAEVQNDGDGPEVLGSHCCDVCIADNLLKNSGIRQCARCMNSYCIHYASKIDPLMYCVSCMSEMTLTRSVVSKTTEHYNEQTDVTTRYTRKAREIKLEGEDWLFSQRKIRDLSDPELDMVIEYHRQYLMLLCDEQERRRMEKMHRHAGVKFTIPTGTATSSTTTTTTTTKKTVVKTDKAKEKAQALIAQLLGAGMSLEQLQATLLNKK